MADLKISQLSAITTLAGTEEFVVADSGTTKKITADNVAAGMGGGLFDAYAVVREEQAANTSAGTFTSGAWQTRVLNTELFDPDGIVSLSSNQFTLQAGTYFIVARAPGFKVARHKAKLYNASDAADVAIGASAFTANSDGVQTLAVVVARVTIASAKAFEIQHRCQTTVATQGFGVESNFGVVEVYTEVEIWREA